MKLKRGLSAEERVARGAMLLDLAHPQWHVAINTADLDINHYERCILGQLYGDYRVGVRKFCIERKQAESYGFMIKSFFGCPNHLDRWRLKRAWRKRVAERPGPVDYSATFNGMTAHIAIVDEIAAFDVETVGLDKELAGV